MSLPSNQVRISCTPHSVTLLDDTHSHEMQTGYMVKEGGRMLKPLPELPGADDSDTCSMHLLMVTSDELA